MASDNKKKETHEGLRSRGTPDTKFKDTHASSVHDGEEADEEEEKDSLQYSVKSPNMLFSRSSANRTGLLIIVPLGQSLLLGQLSKKVLVVMVCWLTFVNPALQKLR